MREREVSDLNGLARTSPHFHNCGVVHAFLKVETKCGPNIYYPTNHASLPPPPLKTEPTWKKFLPQTRR